MRLLLLVSLLTLTCLSITALVACGDDDDDDNDDNNAGDDDEVDDDTADDDSGGDCTAEELCQFSLDCSLGFESMDECLAASDEQLQNCADADAYSACLCDCFLTGPTCNGYIGCGLSCYGDHC